MEFFKVAQEHLAKRRKTEEVFYEIALQEIQSGKVRQGLMAKAMTQTGGSQLKAQPVYMKLLVQAMKDEYFMGQRDLARSNSANRVSQESGAGKRSANHVPVKATLASRIYKEVMFWFYFAGFGFLAIIIFAEIAKRNHWY